jgi:hypothetical protein
MPLEVWCHKPRLVEPASLVAVVRLALHLGHNSKLRWIAANPSASRCSDTSMMLSRHSLTTGMRVCSSCPVFTGSLLSISARSWELPNMTTALVISAREISTTSVVLLALPGAPRARAGAPQAARTPDSGTTIPLRVHRWPPGEAGAGRYARFCTGSQSLAS